MTRKNTTRGFTLLEVLIAVLIVGIIATAVVPLLSSYTEKAREARDEANDVIKMQAQERYIAEHHAPLGYVWEESSSSFLPFELASLTGPSKQLLMPTDIDGNVMGEAISSRPGPFAYGPYLAQLPPEPASLLLAMDRIRKQVPSWARQVEAVGVGVGGDTVTLTLTMYKLEQDAAENGRANAKALANTWKTTFTISDVLKKLEDRTLTAEEVKRILDAYVFIVNTAHTHGVGPGWRLTNDYEPYRPDNQSQQWEPGTNQDILTDLADAVVKTGKDFRNYTAAAGYIGPYANPLAHLATDIAASTALRGQWPTGEPFDVGQVVATQRKVTKWFSNVDERVEEYFANIGKPISKANQNLVADVIRNTTGIDIAFNIYSTGTKNGLSASLTDEAYVGQNAIALRSMDLVFSDDELRENAKRVLDQHFGIPIANQLAKTLGLTRRQEMNDDDWLRIVREGFKVSVLNPIAGAAGEDLNYLVKAGADAAGHTGYVGSSTLDIVIHAPDRFSKEGSLPHSAAALMASANDADLKTQIDDNITFLEGAIKGRMEALRDDLPMIKDKLKMANTSLVGFTDFYVVPKYEFAKEEEKRKKYHPVLFLSGDINQPHVIPAVMARESLRKQFQREFGAQSRDGKTSITHDIARKIGYAAKLDEAVTKAAVK